MVHEEGWRLVRHKDGRFTAIPPARSVVASRDRPESGATRLSRRDQLESRRSRLSVVAEDPTGGSDRIGLGRILGCRRYIRDGSA